MKKNEREPFVIRSNSESLGKAFVDELEAIKYPIRKFTGDTLIYKVFGTNGTIPAYVKDNPEIFIGDSTALFDNDKKEFNLPKDWDIALQYCKDFLNATEDLKFVAGDLIVVNKNILTSNWKKQFKNAGGKVGYVFLSCHDFENYEVRYDASNKYVTNYPPETVDKATTDDIYNYLLTLLKEKGITKDSRVSGIGLNIQLLTSPFEKDTKDSDFVYVKSGTWIIAVMTLKTGKVEICDKIDDNLIISNDGVLVNKSSTDITIHFTDIGKIVISSHILDVLRTLVTNPIKNYKLTITWGCKTFSKEDIDICLKYFNAN